MKTFIAAGLSLAIAATAAPALAKGGKNADQNGDGRISMEEYQAKAEHQFQRLDRDNNGQVSRAEYNRKLERKMSRKAGDGSAHSRKRGGKDRFAKLDLNGDQVLSMDEYMRSIEKKFARRDRGGQGYITPGHGERDTSS